MPRPRRRDIAGTPISMVDYDQAVDAIFECIADGRREYVCVAPTHTVVTARRDAGLLDTLDGALLVTPDGMPVVWAARLLGEELRTRVYGPDLMLMCCERAAVEGRSVWLYGGFDDDALAQLRTNLGQRFPGLNICGWHSPPHRDLTDYEHSAIVERINADQPDIVWVGLGMPKQERWMAQLRPLLDAPVLCGVGAAFDFHAGRVRQAPRWMQNNGLEWLFRLAQEPRRLFARYAVSNPIFVALVTAQFARERLRLGRKAR